LRQCNGFVGENGATRQQTTVILADKCRFETSMIQFAYAGILDCVAFSHHGLGAEVYEPIQDPASSNPSGIAEVARDLGAGYFVAAKNCG
jgi:hypothetical protein